MATYQSNLMLYGEEYLKQTEQAYVEQHRERQRHVDPERRAPAEQVSVKSASLGKVVRDMLEPDEADIRRMLRPRISIDGTS